MSKNWNLTGHELNNMVVKLATTFNGVSTELERMELIDRDNWFNETENIISLWVSVNMLHRTLSGSVFTDATNFRVNTLLKTYNRACRHFNRGGDTLKFGSHFE